MLERDGKEGEIESRDSVQHKVRNKWNTVLGYTEGHPD